MHAPQFDTIDALAIILGLLFIIYLIRDTMRTRD